jgi:hypothetical protein
MYNLCSLDGGCGSQSRVCNRHSVGPTAWASTQNRPKELVPVGLGPLWSIKSHPPWVHPLPSPWQSLHPITVSGN